MTPIIEYKEFLIIGMLIALFISTIVLILLYYERTRRAGYNEKLMRAELEKLRDSYENKIYQIMERLTSTEERWRDLNHLIISGQESQADALKSEAIHLTNYMKKSGVADEDTLIDKKLVFVLTPFHEKYSGTYYEIERICKKIGLKCLRGDEENIIDIFPHILRLIVKARLIIANVDGRNPNVFYELGIAHAIDKPVILLSSAFEEESPGSAFTDIKSKRMIIYENYSDLANKLTDELGKALV